MSKARPAACLMYLLDVRTAPVVAAGSWVLGEPGSGSALLGAAWCP